MEEFKVNSKLLEVLNNEGVCKTLAMQKYAKENIIPVLRPNTASLLISLIRTAKPKIILEIGTAIGYSGTLMLENSDANVVLHTIEKDENNAEIAKENFEKLGLASNVKIFKGDAIDILAKLKEPYDFIFLDGPKGQYIKYLPHLIRLLKTGGVLFSDNVLYRGMVFSGQFIPAKKRAIVNNLQKFLEEISTNACLKTQIIDLEDGISISIKG
ncbi:MAG: O-methyltransferase [Clostridia bacterium]|nr:O-methyltransferase [Clostridia bacterium]